MMKQFGWGVAYLFLIPAFACIYSVFSDDFKSSNLYLDPQIERSIKAAKQYFLNIVENCETLKPFRIYPSIDFDRGLVEIAVWGTSGDDKKAWFRGLGPDVLRNVGDYDKDRISSSMPFSGLIVGYSLHKITDFSTPGRNTAIGRLDEKQKKVLYGGHIAPFTKNSSSTQNTNISYGLVANVVNKCFGYNAKKIDQGFPRIILPTLIIDTIKLHRSAVIGGSDTLEGKYIRMLYFSTVTITTLGYGDIAPVNNRGRILVSIQSVLGIVFIGLFLNSLATRRN